jgi:hypothetical protein
MYAHKPCVIIPKPTYCYHSFKKCLKMNMTVAPVCIDCVYQFFIPALAKF